MLLRATGASLDGSKVSDRGGGLSCRLGWVEIISAPPRESDKEKRHGAERKRRRWLHSPLLLL